MANIKLRKLTGIQIDNGTDLAKLSSVDFNNTINTSTGKNLVFAGQDYKGTLENSILELYLKGPDDYLKIEGVNVATSTPTNPHTLSEGTATINITSSDKISILERNNEWLTTQLDMKGVTPKDSSIKFGEWNNYDLPDKFHVEINFA